ncbi:MAG: CoA transferase, partial [Frankia sp.]|nr:CoA transferase [Frankia sp.]
MTTNGAAPGAANSPAAGGTAEAARLVLDGIRIVDLSWGLAGPVATQMLASAGADVIKVEPPSGDPMRRLYPAAFATWNRDKRSVVLDLDDPRLADLLATADVLVHSLRPSTARRHGLDDETLAARYPRLVVCGITGYPRGHADAERPGYDLLVQARAGLMDVQVGWREGPIVWRFFAPSWGAAYLAATGVAARLYHRARGDKASADGHGGRGGPAHTSLAQGLHLILNLAWCQAENPTPSLLEGQPGTLVLPQVALYRCRDGAWIQILNPADRVDLSVMPLMKEAIAELGREGEPFSADLMRAALARRDSAGWVAQVRALDVAVDIVAPIGEILRNPDVAANGFAVRVDDAEFGPTLQAAPPFRGDQGFRAARPAPRLGEHNDLLTGLPAAPARAPASQASASPTAGGGHPLAGLRVVDFGAFLAGPLATMVLADLGADVVTVEPVTGDPVRGWRDVFFVASNRGKRGVALDIAFPSARPAIERLIRWADVVHHNIRAKTAVRLRLDRDTVNELNPRAVYGHVSAYGLHGPMADAPGFDSIFQSMAGWQLANAGEGNPPLFVHLGYIDILTAMSSAVATLLALYHRERTGEVTASEAALLSTAVFTTSETMLRLETDTLTPVPVLDSQQTGLAPGYRIYQTSDGWVAVVALDADALGVVCRVVGAESVEDLAARVAERGSEELAAALTAAGIAAEVVRELRYFSVWEDEEELRTRMVVSYPQADWGEMRQFGAYWDFGDLDLRLDRACPAVGQHTAEVLAELGLTAEEIEALLAAGA